MCVRTANSGKGYGKAAEGEITYPAEGLKHSGSPNIHHKHVHF